MKTRGKDFWRKNDEAVWKEERFILIMAGISILIGLWRIVSDCLK